MKQKVKFEAVQIIKRSPNISAMPFEARCFVGSTEILPFHECRYEK
jgi:hypothetical protein